MMKAFAIGTLAALVLTCSASTTTVNAQTKDIVETAVSAGSFKTLATALKAADLVDDAEGRGAVHGLRPDRRGVRQAAGGHAGEPAQAGEQGEAAADSDVSRRVRQGHGGGRREAAHGQDRQRRHDRRSPAQRRQRHGRQANVVKTDIAASNGVIHVIDAVILPKASRTGMARAFCSPAPPDTSAAAFFGPSKKAATPSVAWRGSPGGSRRPGRPLKWCPVTASTRRRSIARLPA